MSISLKDRVLSEVGKAVVGRDSETEMLLVCLLAGGHCLIEGVPGVSKTILAKTFSKCMGLSFKRVQFTPDMIPLDILGGFIFNLKTREFDFRRGPVFTNLLLADEINRAPPKVQSALLEAMQEQQVTVEGHTEVLPSPFMIIATENPLEFHGVFPLPEGQLDRFMMRLYLGYPDRKLESEILRKNMKFPDLSSLDAVCTREELAEAIVHVSEVEVSDEILDYLTEIAAETRSDKRVRLGASPRAMVHLTQASRAVAYLAGRNYATPDDVKSIIGKVLTHRIELDAGAVLTSPHLTREAVVREVTQKVPPPR
jgi:MoxR-like ATPase